MKKLEKAIIDQIKTMNGNLLAIGVEDNQLLQAIENNTAIINCNLLSQNMTTLEERGIIQKRRSKRIDIYKIKKLYRKEKTTYTLGNLAELHQYMRSFMKSSMLITEDTVYLYGKEADYDVEKLVKRYRRYTDDIIVEQVQDAYLVTVSMRQLKKRRGMRILYSIADCLIDGIDLVSDVLVN